MLRIFSRKVCFTLACFSVVVAIGMDLKRSVAACAGGCHKVKAIAYQSATPGVAISRDVFEGLGQGMKENAEDPSEGTYQNGGGTIRYIKCPDGNALCPFPSTEIYKTAEGNAQTGQGCDPTPHTTTYRECAPASN